ncbi:PTS sugar transporter subunit IIA [uncultured Olegusella sp.]|uniref:PTS sugar transporter subunit IIA n=1 Tax=uncultured Olegusella sp. TaxID=1979846 RepID=UPI002614C726|nr:PTS sugar transporter subunit IIA [uncultured Olegusella sp.]
MLLKEIYDRKHYAFTKGPMDWREAIRESCKPLEADGTCDERYAEEIIACVEKHGPYIVIIPHVAMPHSTEGAVGAHKTAIGFMHCDTPVSFDDDDPDKQVQTFFTLCATDSNAHLANMQRLVAVLMNDEVVEQLKAIQTPEQLLEIDALAGDNA